MIVVIVVAVAVIDAIAVIVVFCTYICMYVVLLMVALMFLHSYSSQIPILDALLDPSALNLLQKCVGNPAQNLRMF